jgi:hypothetical protein
MSNFRISKKSLAYLANHGFVAIKAIEKDFSVFSTEDGSMVELFEKGSEPKEMTMDAVLKSTKEIPANIVLPVSLGRALMKANMLTIPQGYEIGSPFKSKFNNGLEVFSIKEKGAALAFLDTKEEKTQTATADQKVF